MRRGLLRAAAVAAIALPCGASAVASQQPTQQRPPVFRGESVLVTVDVYPQRDGRIVEGLTTGDFQVLEDGKPQTVENFEFVRVEPGLPESTRRDPNSIGEMMALAADPHNRVFVVFLDQLHVTVAGSISTRQPMVDSLNRIIGPNDLFGVMTQNTDPRAITFGRRMVSVEEQLSRYWNWGERYRQGPDPDDIMEESLRHCFQYKLPREKERLPPWFVMDNSQRRFLFEVLIDRRREDRTLTALERLIDQVGAMREARTVTLLVTEGWRLFRDDQALGDEATAFGPTLPQVASTAGRITLGDTSNSAGRDNVLRQQCKGELLRLSGLDDDSRFKEIIKGANRANTSFYPVNPAGLRVFDTPLTEAGRPGFVEDGNRRTLRADSLRTLAENTDGIAVIDTTDLATGMRRIVDDMSAYYLLGYYSTNTVHDGRFRNIEVKTKASGLKVRARRGYVAPDNIPVRKAFAAAPAGPEPPKGLDTALGELGSLRTLADVFTRGAIVGDHVQLVVEIASSRAGVAPWSGRAEVQVVLAPDGGPPLAAVTGRIEPNTRGVLLTVPLGSAAESVRVVTKISAGGETFDDTAEVSRGAGGLVGDAVLYRGRPAATSPLRPVADLQYRRTERVHVEWIMTGDLDQRSARLLSKTGQPLAIPVAVTERETEGHRVVAVDLNLAPLSAGDYLIELTVGRGATTELRLVAFRVVP